MSTGWRNGVERTVFVPIARHPPALVLQVGQLRRHEDRVLVATGFRKWGMTNGTAAAQILADTILGRENAWADAFEATRVAPGPSLADFVRQNLDVARRFVGDRIGRWRTPPSDTLAG
jgi:hypothetical protein